MDEIIDLSIIGGGAAGIFAAIAAKEIDPTARVVVLEKNNVLLSKVRISGEGRCNVTHACFEPALLVKNYPRGEKELLGPFHQFQPENTIQWFEERGVKIKIERDGRCFPISDSSTTIIDCLLTHATKLGVEIFKNEKIQEIEKKENYFVLKTASVTKYTKQLLLTTGSSKEGHLWAKNLGHTIHEPVPSLFTFNIPNFSLSDLSGVAIDPVEVRLVSSTFKQRGALLLTHFGLSGPAVLKLSAWGARFLHQCNYQTLIAINWLCDEREEKTRLSLLEQKAEKSQKKICNENPFRLPKNLWKALVHEFGEEKWGAVSDKRLAALAHLLHNTTYLIQGKTTHKEEFVSCGGVALQEIDFKTMQSKKCPGLFFAGEILDIDGITGGFNFQNAWTTGYIAGRHSVIDDHTPST